MTHSSHHLTPTSGSVSDLPAVESLFVAALIACCGSTRALRQSATAVFLHAAPAAVWGMMARHTTARISHHALMFITRRSVVEFLHAWPSSDSLTVASMLLVLERSVAESHVSVDTCHSEPRTALDTPLGALARVGPSHRMALIECVRAQLSGAELTELAIVAQHRPLTAGAPTDGEHLQVRTRAVRRLEEALLGGAMYELGVPASAIAVDIAA